MAQYRDDDNIQVLVYPAFSHGVKNLILTELLTLSFQFYDVYKR